jgi:hypothetical protein
MSQIESEKNQRKLQDNIFRKPIGESFDPAIVERGTGLYRNTTLELLVLSACVENLKYERVGKTGSLWHRTAEVVKYPFR